MCCHPIFQFMGKDQEIKTKQNWKANDCWTNSNCGRDLVSRDIVWIFWMMDYWLRQGLEKCLIKIDNFRRLSTESVKIKTPKKELLIKTCTIEKSWSVTIMGLLNHSMKTQNIAHKFHCLYCLYSNTQNYRK